MPHAVCSTFYVVRSCAAFSRSANAAAAERHMPHCKLAAARAAEQKRKRADPAAVHHAAATHSAPPPSALRPKSIASLQARGRHSKAGRDGPSATPSRCAANARSPVAWPAHPPVRLQKLAAPAGAEADKRHPPAERDAEVAKDAPPPPWCTNCGRSFK
jgi:hypothetical protein